MLVYGKHTCMVVCLLCCSNHPCRITRGPTCDSQGIPFGVKPPGQQCITPPGLCTTSSLSAVPSSQAPCCRTCRDFSSSNQWFWQCTLPSVYTDAPATYTFEMIAGQYYYMGRCEVVVSSTTVTVQNCIVADGWTATKAHIYLGETVSNTCSPGQFGYQATFSATTGPLPPAVTRTMTRSTATSPVFVMLHLDAQR